LLGLKKIGLRVADHLSYHFHFESYTICNKSKYNCLLL
jgi:hypothetical protein